MTTVSRLPFRRHLEGRSHVSLLFFFAQFRQDTKILEGRRVAGHGFATGNFLEQPPHDLAAARFWQRFGESDFVRLRDRADVNADMIAQFYF